MPTKIHILLLCRYGDRNNVNEDFRQTNQENHYCPAKSFKKQEGNLLPVVEVLLDGLSRVVAKVSENSLVEAESMLENALMKNRQYLFLSTEWKKKTLAVPM